MIFGNRLKNPRPSDLLPRRQASFRCGLRVRLDTLGIDLQFYGKKVTLVGNDLLDTSHKVPLDFGLIVDLLQVFAGELFLRFGVEQSVAVRRDGQSKFLQLLLGFVQVGGVADRDRINVVLTEGAAVLILDSRQEAAEGPGCPRKTKQELTVDLRSKRIIVN